MHLYVCLLIAPIRQRFRLFVKSLLLRPSFIHQARQARAAAEQARAAADQAKAAAEAAEEEALRKFAEAEAYLEKVACDNYWLFIDDDEWLARR